MHYRSPQQSPASALVVAHPGHELRIHHWVEAASPTVFVLTDGSGHSNPSRLPSTERTLTAAGATPGSIFGRYTDRQLYEAILNGDHALFINLARELAAAFRDLHVTLVAADACEGYNPVHDLCRSVVDAAVRLASSGDAGALHSYDFTTVGRPDTCREEQRSALVRLDLDDEAFTRKMDAVRGYPELAAEAESALRSVGESAFRIECLRPVQPGALPDLPPFYEEYGQRQVAAGRYRQAIRYADHMAPIAAVLQQLGKAEA